MYSVTYEIQQGGVTLPIIFVKRKEAKQYAQKQGITNYQIVRDTDRLY